MLTSRPMDVRVSSLAGTRIRSYLPLLSQLMNIFFTSPVHSETPSAAGYVIFLNNLDPFSVFHYIA